MAKTKDKVRESAGSVRPYVERAIKDQELRENVRNAYESARDVYNELTGGRGVVAMGSRIASDKEMQDSLRDAIDELRTAARRLQGKEEHTGRNTMLLLVGIALGVLFNPATDRRRAGGCPTSSSAAATTSPTRAETAARSRS